MSILDYYVQIQHFSRIITSEYGYIKSFLQQYFGENAVADLQLAAIIFAVTIVVVWVIKTQIVVLLGKYAKKTKMKTDDAILETIQGIKLPFFAAVALYASVQHMQLPELLGTVIHALFLIAVIFEVIKLLEKVITFFASAGLSKGKEGKKVSTLITFAVRLVLWVVGLLLILSNLGFNVNSLIASLGIGGIAISLALQNILGDLFSSVSIMIDKPFEEGDFIVAGTDKGTVKHIGLKTTRIEALQGEEIIISNTELTTTRISNFKKLKERRILFTVSAAYGTPTSKLKKVPKMIKDIITTQKNARFDRAHFGAMNAYSLDFEVVYYVKDGDYAKYMNIQQNINLEILKAFEKEGIEMPFPTQTVHVAKE